MPGNGSKGKDIQIKEEDLTHDQHAYMQIVRGETCNIAMLFWGDCLNLVSF